MGAEYANANRQTHRSVLDEEDKYQDENGIGYLHLEVKHLEEEYDANRQDSMGTLAGSANETENVNVTGK